MSWKFLSDANLGRGTDGNLVVEATVPSTAVVAVLTNPTLAPINGSTCRSNLGVQFRRNSNVNTKHYVEVVSASNASSVYAYVSDVIIANNTTYNFTRRLPTTALKVNVWEYETYANKGRLIVSQDLPRPCDFNTSRRLTINVNPPSVTNRKIARFELDTYCQNSRLFYYHEGRIEYRLSGSQGPWFDLGLARRSGSTITEILRFRGTTPPPNLPPSATPSYSWLETDRLENGQTYDFRVTISGRNRTNTTTVTKTFTKTRIFNETEFELLTGRTPVTYQFLKFKRSYWLANATEDSNPCAVWGY
jgi:hypothetical protein